MTLQWSVGQGYAQELIRLKFEDECLAVSIKVGIRKWNDFSCQKVRCSRTWEIAGTYTHIDIEDVSCVIEHSATLNFNDLKCQSSRHIVRSRFETYRHRNNRNCNYLYILMQMLNLDSCLVGSKAKTSNFLQKKQILLLYIPK